MQLRSKLELSEFLHDFFNTKSEDKEVPELSNVK